MDIARFIATVRPWRRTQYVGRVRALSKGYLKRAFPVSARKFLEEFHPVGLEPRPFAEEPVWPRPADSTALHARARDIQKGSFSFCGINHEFRGGIEWRSQFGNYLWNVELHAFGFLDASRCFAQTQSEPGSTIRHAKELMHDWVNRCRYPHTPGWHPEVISRRILSWIRFLIDYPGPDDGPLHNSISQQITCLERNVESFLPGTQLVENGVALAAAGLYFSCEGRPKQWLVKGSRILKDALDEQVLPGGGHIQRAPMYQCKLIEELLICYNLFQARHMSPVWLKQKIEPMMQRLLDLLHPDGRIPLLNDSVFDYASEPADILDYACRSFPFSRRAPAREYEDDGYVTFRDATSFLVIDGGPIGPEYLPSHGHADTLTYELSLGTRRVIVDSGVFSYQPDAIRAHCRGTAGHNTVVVDSRDQSEMWRTFRVGHRAHPFPPIVVDNDDLSVFIGGHDGYRNLEGGVIHHRTLLHARDRFYIVSDSLTGSGTHRLESHVHLAPGLQARRDGNRIVVTCLGETVLQIVPFGCELPQTSHNWYCPAFGVKLPHIVITLLLVAELPCHFGYFLIPGDCPGTVACGFEKDNSYYSLESEDGSTCTIRGSNERYALDVR